jgi:ribosomal protein S18 acetylase RimI-like enzyme
MIDIIECNFSEPVHCQAVVDLMNDYMVDKMGGMLPRYTPAKAAAMLDGLSRHPSKLVLLATCKNEYAGLSNCFINFGTFAAKPYINIHDIIVRGNYRGQGIGRRLIEEIIRRARELDCSKITLEVRDDNKNAQALYANCGFKESSPVMHFWTKHI